MIIDQSSAFDCVNFTILLEKLKLWNLSEEAVSWVRNYLMNITQYISIGRAKSDMRAMSRGVPQGSVLGRPTYNSNGLLFLTKWCLGIFQFWLTRLIFNIVEFVGQYLILANIPLNCNNILFMCFSFQHFNSENFYSFKLSIINDQYWFPRNYTDGEKLPSTVLVVVNVVEPAVLDAVVVCACASGVDHLQESVAVSPHRPTWAL